MADATMPPSPPPPSTTISKHVKDDNGREINADKMFRSKDLEEERKTTSRISAEALKQRSKATESKDRK